MIEKGNWVQIQSYKHDGSLHRCWTDGFAVEINDEYIIIASRSTKVIEADGRRWYTREPAVTFFSRRNWFNIIAMFKNNGINYYCNIASPSIIDKDIVKYIDYDLDLKLYPDNTVKVLDEREYEKHRLRYEYGDSLHLVLTGEVKRMISMMKERKYPFNDEAARKYYEEFLKNEESK